MISSKPEVKLGLVAISPHMEEHLIPSIFLIPEFKIYAFSSTDAIKTTRLKQSLKASHFEDWRLLVADDDIDAVIVAGPPSFNADVIEASILNGKPVFTEKPCAPNSHRLLQLLEVQQKHSGLTQVGFNFRHSRYFTNLMSLEARFGSIVALDIEYSANKPLSTLWNCDSVFESFLLAVGIHPLNTLCTFLVDGFRYKSLVSELSNEIFQLRILANDENRSVTVLTGNYSPRFFASFRASFENGTVAITNSDKPSLIQIYLNNISQPTSGNILPSRSECVETKKEMNIDREGSGYQAEMLMFYKLITTGRNNGYSIHNSLSTLELIENLIDIRP